ncbi:EBP2 protein, partial [Acromyrmex insinuator]
MSETSESDSEYNSSNEELQDAFAKGLLNPGLNVAIKTSGKQSKNYVNHMKQKLDEIKMNLPWIERLDMVNALAPLAPELALQMQEQEVRRAKQLQGNRKLPQYKPSEDPVVNDFHRENIRYRKDLDFLDDKVDLKLKTTHVNRKINPKAQFKMQIKAAKFGCGGDKKCCSKWNTRSSSADVFEYRPE